MPTPNYHGYLDGCSGGIIRGWAADLNAQRKSIDVIIEIRSPNASLCEIVIANHFRQDLVDAGIENGAHGFEFVVPPLFLTGEEVEVSVKFKDNASPLNHAPQKAILWRALDATRELAPRVSIIRGLAGASGVGLEVGPSYNPVFPKRDGYRVETVDHATAEQLRIKYASAGVDTSRIENVDYVWNGEMLSDLIPKHHHYDYIFAGHVIEHLPDIVAFFEASARLLKPTGALVLAVPDKRYCFDVLGRLSSTGEILQAGIERRARHTAGQVFDHFAYVAFQAGQSSWAAGSKGAPDFVHSLAEAVHMLSHARLAAEYIDVHAWRFTPSSFRLIACDLRASGATTLRETGFHDTLGNEFFIRLGLDGEGCPIDRRALNLAILEELMLSAHDIVGRS